jgi:hypothetical protein
MEVLRRDLEKVITISDCLILRENHKRDLCLLDTEIFDAELEEAFHSKLKSRKREMSAEKQEILNSLLASKLPRSEYASVWQAFLICTYVLRRENLLQCFVREEE